MQFYSSSCGILFERSAAKEHSDTVIYMEDGEDIHCQGQLVRLE